MELPCLVASQFPAMSGAFLDSPYNGDVSLQASSVNIAPNVIRQLEPEEETKVSREAIWLWVAIIATIGNIIVVGVVCVCAF
eukprot:gi/632990708/ref/XP_007884292.1/ PREDICTED: putative uncharacterized protein C14orf132 homolog [Callorhinchus milii]